MEKKQDCFAELRKSLDARIEESEHQGWTSSELIEMALKLELELQSMARL